MVFIDKIKSLYPISAATERMLVDSVTVCRFSRKHLLVKAGEYCRSAYFTEKGMTRSYWLVDGNEITTSFSGVGDIVFSMDELYYNKVSEEYVEALEDMVAYRICIGDLLELFRTNIEIANWGRIIHQNEYRRLHRSHRDRLTLSAEERYVEFRKQFPQVCQRVQLGYIASYLGTTLPTLSRLRSKGTASGRNRQEGDEQCGDEKFVAGQIPDR